MATRHHCYTSLFGKTYTPNEICWIYTGRVTVHNRNDGSIYRNTKVYETFLADLEQDAVPQATWAATIHDLIARKSEFTTLYVAQELLNRGNSDEGFN